MAKAVSNEQGVIAPSPAVGNINNASDPLREGKLPNLPGDTLVAQVPYTREELHRIRERVELDLKHFKLLYDLQDQELNLWQLKNIIPTELVDRIAANATGADQLRKAYEKAYNNTKELLRTINRNFYSPDLDGSTINAYRHQIQEINNAFATETRIGQENWVGWASAYASVAERVNVVTGIIAPVLQSAQSLLDRLDESKTIAQGKSIIEGDPGNKNALTQLYDTAPGSAERVSIAIALSFEGAQHQLLGMLKQIQTDPIGFVRDFI